MSYVKKTTGGSNCPPPPAGIGLTEKNGREIESVATQELTILHRVQRKERKQNLQLVQLNTGLRKKLL